MNVHACLPACAIVSYSTSTCFSLQADTVIYIVRFKPMGCDCLLLLGNHGPENKNSYPRRIDSSLVPL